MKPVAFAQLSKVDVEKRLVYGRAAQETPDHSGEVMDYEQSKPNFQKWSDEMNKATNGASMGNIRAMHGNVAAGKVQELIYNDDEHAIDVVAKIVDENEWQKVLEGVYTGFSIGGKYGARVTKGDFKHYEAIPSEISLVDRPCIPTATFFDIQKADGSVMQKQFQSLPQDTIKGASNMPPIEYEVVGTAEDADALAKFMHDNKLSIGDALKTLEKSAAPDADAQFQKRYGVEEIIELDQDYAREILELEKVAAREDVNPKAGEKKYGDVKFADEKNNKYPIENEAHIRAAWNYISKDKNAAKYSAEDLKAIKGKIVAAWKEKIDKDGPPAAAEKAEQAGDLKKGISAVSMLGDMLQSLYYLANSCVRESASEGDNSPIPARLKQVVLDIAGIYKDMATEEADELLEELYEGEQPEVMQMAYSLAGSLAKAGARNSTADAEMLQKMHDLTAKLGANCALNNNTGAAAGSQSDMDTKDSAAATNLQVAQKAEAASDLTKLEVPNDMAKMIAEAVAPLSKALQEANDKIIKLEAQPMPSKGVLRVVDKAGDVIGSVVEKKDIPPVIDRDGKVNEAATMLKSIHQNGGTPLIGGFPKTN